MRRTELMGGMRQTLVVVSTVLAGALLSAGAATADGPKPVGRRLPRRAE